MPAPSFLTPVTDSSIFLFLVLHTRGGAWGMELPQAFLFVPNPEPRTPNPTRGSCCCPTWSPVLVNPNPNLFVCVVLHVVL